MSSPEASKLSVYEPAIRSSTGEPSEESLERRLRPETTVPAGPTSVQNTCVSESVSR